MGIYSNTPNTENFDKSKIESNYKQIIWKDQNVNNEENRFTLQYFKSELKNDYNMII